jgi:hypothetical protein
MKRFLSVSLGIFTLLIGLSIGYPLASSLAMTSNDSGGSTCTESSYPAPYTGGAGVAKFFYLSDGSTVTITTTGAVIKQSPCHTAYREGWINVSDICNIQSAHDLNGRLSPGSSNPFGSTGFTGCSTKTQSPNVQPAPTATTTASAQSNATTNVNVNSPPAVKAASTTAAVQPASTTIAAQPAAAPKALPNTGPGNILMLSGATSAVGTIGHWYYSRRSRRSR